VACVARACAAVQQELQARLMLSLQQGVLLPFHIAFDITTPHWSSGDVCHQAESSRVIAILKYCLSLCLGMS
jgi:hypothetical protein